MGYPVDFEKGELNRGNWKRIKACMKKAEAGDFKLWVGPNSAEGLEGGISLQ